MTFAERLRELREKAGMTQEALARESGLSLGAVKNYEQGIREPYWHIVFKLVGALGVSCEVFKDCAAAEANRPQHTPPVPAKPAARPASKRSPGKATGESTSGGKADQLASGGQQADSPAEPAPKKPKRKKTT